MSGGWEPNLLRGINNKLEFGKHKGKTLQVVMKEDPNWIHWALQNIKDFKLNKNALLLLPPQKPTIYGGRDGTYFDDVYPFNNEDLDL